MTHCAICGAHLNVAPFAFRYGDVDSNAYACKFCFTANALHMLPINDLLDAIFKKLHEITDSINILTVRQFSVWTNSYEWRSATKQIRNIIVPLDDISIVSESFLNDILLDIIQKYFNIKMTMIDNPIEKDRVSKKKSINLSTAQVEAAANVDLVDYCQKVMIPIEPSQGGYYRHRDYDSLKIKGNMWRRWSGKTTRPGGHTAGNSIIFVREYESLDFAPAVLRLLEVCCPSMLPKDYKGSVKLKLTSYQKKNTNKNKLKKLLKDGTREGEQQSIRAAATTESNVDHTKKPRSEKAPQKKIFALPPRHTDTRRVFAYLTKTRAIDPEIVNHFIKHGSLYEDKEHHNCVFVGYDSKNTPRFATLKGTYIPTSGETFGGDVEGSKKMFGWCYTPNVDSTVLRIFETPIDAMSYMSMVKLSGGDWHDSHYLSLDGLAYVALPEYLKHHAEIQNIAFCLDNDIAGRQKTEEFVTKLRKIRPFSCTSWPNRNTMILCSFSDYLNLIRFLDAHSQIKNLVFQIKRESDRAAAEDFMKKLSDKGFVCSFDNASRSNAKDFNEMLQREKKVDTILP